MKTKKDKQWIVTISNERPFTEIKKDAIKTGFLITDVYETIGSFSGKGSNDVVDKLRKISGINDVSPDEIVDIGPPDSAIS